MVDRRVRVTPDALVETLDALDAPLPDAAFRPGR
jgi:hypothetical protein